MSERYKGLPWWPPFIALLFVCVLGVTSHWAAEAGVERGRLELANEAVQHGAATWGVTEDGERVFIWLPSAEESRKREAAWRAGADQILFNEGEARDGE